MLGTNNGFLNVTGAGNVLNLASGINIMIDGTGTAFNPSTNYSYTVATAPAVAGLSAGTPITTQSQFVSIGFNASNYSLSTDGTQVFLNFTTAAVPEPGTILSLAAAGLGLVRFVRRRRAK